MIKTRLADLRTDNDYSQKDIADILNVSRRTYAGWETNRLIPINKLPEIANIYNVNIDYILCNSRISKRKYDPLPFEANNIGIILRDLRSKYNYTQQELADMLHVKQNIISMWENGKSSIQIDELISLSKIFKISIDKLIGIERI